MNAFNSCSFKLSLKQNIVKYLQCVNIWRLTPGKNTEINNSGSAIADLVISLSPSNRIQTYVRKFNPAIYAKCKWLNGCAERNPLLGLRTNYVIILASAVPQSATSRHCIHRWLSASKLMSNLINNYRLGVWNLNRPSHCRMALFPSHAALEKNQFFPAYVDCHLT